MTPLRLLADIGGTNIRLAWQDQPDGPLHDTRVLPCAQFPTVDAALSAYLAEVNIATPREAAFGIANPVTGDAIRMTNHSWSFSQRAVREAFGFERLVVINDFTALALALPLLTPEQLRPVGGGEAVPGAAIALLGPGTGLGVSGLVRVAYHVYQGPTGALSVLVAGTVLSVWSWRTRRTWPAIVAHATTDLVGLAWA